MRNFLLFKLLKQFLIYVLFAQIVITPLAIAQGLPLGARIYQSSDTERNSVSKIMAEYWRDGKNGQDGIIFDSPFQPYYEANDIEVMTQERKSLRVSTSSENMAGTYYNFPKPISMRNKSLRFRVKVSDWSQIKELSLILSSGDDSFARSFTLDLTEKLHGQTNNNWVVVTAPISNFYSYNSPNMLDIYSALWRVRDKGVSRVETEIAGFQIIDNGSIARISVTIDDGDLDSLIAKRIMDQYGMKGSLFIDPSAIGQKGFLSQKQLDLFARDGWNIGAHDINYNLRAMSTQEVDSFLGSTAAYLTDRQYAGREYFAYPGGLDDPRINALVSKHFKYALNVDSTSNAGSTISDYRINRMSIDRWTTLAQVKKWIDDAKSDHEYLVLNFHTFSATRNTDENISPEFFLEIIQYIDASQVLVQTVSEAVESINATQLSEEIKSIPRISLLPIAQVDRITLIDPRRQDFGVGLAQTVYSNPGATYLGQELQFLANYNDGNYALKGGLGIGVLSGKNYLVGDMTAMKFVNANSLISFGVYGDVVNSVLGLQQGVTQQGWNIGGDLYNDYGGLSLSGTQSYFTQGNTQTGGTAKIYAMTAYEGVHIYIKDRYYINSQADTPLFYSPQYYQRLTTGLGWRKVVGENIYSGWADAGQANAAGTKIFAGSGRFALDHVENKAITYGVALGTDISAASNYQYYYVDAHFKYTF
jgi:hypothetical protein